MSLTPVEVILARIATDARMPLFLDFDGTLVEFSDRPADVRLPDSVHLSIALLLEQTWPVTIVSGRDLSSLRTIFPIELIDRGLSLIGCHGAESLRRYDSPGLMTRLQTAGETLGNVYDTLNASGGVLEAFWLEKKRYSLCLHNRERNSVVLANVVEAVEAAIRHVDERGLLRTIVSKGSVEMLPRWCSKAQAIEDTLGGDANSLGSPFIIGDDESDEEAFRAFRGTAITVRVGAIGVPTAADHHLQSPAQVRQLLDALATPC